MLQIRKNRQSFFIAHSYALLKREDQKFTMAYIVIPCYV